MQSEGWKLSAVKAFSFKKLQEFLLFKFSVGPTVLALIYWDYYHLSNNVLAWINLIGVFLFFLDPLRERMTNK